MDLVLLITQVMRWILSSDREASRFFLPLTISMTTTPKLYISTFSVICDVNHSGAKYPGVPLILVITWLLSLSMSLHIPKSESLALKLSSSRIFCGLTSK